MQKSILTLQSDVAKMSPGHETTAGGRGPRWVKRLLLSLAVVAGSCGAGWAAPGDLDGSFVADPVATNSVRALASTDGTNILVGGWISAANLVGDPLAGVVRLASDGSLDNSFAVPAVATAVTALAFAPGGQVVCAGLQTNGLNSVIRRLNADGSLDSTMDSTVSGTLSPWIYALAVQPDGRVLAGGNFATVAGSPRVNLVRLQAAGTLDNSFKTNFTCSGEIRAVAVQPDGRILIGGVFTNVNSTARRGIARLNADGTLDSTFNPGTGISGTVHVIRVQVDNRILIGGHFFSYSGTSRSCVARLLPDGALDTSFDPGLGAEASPGSLAPDWPSVETIEIQGDGRILVAGKFARMDGLPRAHLARLDWDGSVDTTFDPGTGPDAPVLAVAIQGDGDIVVGGDFAQVSGVPVHRLARLSNNGALPVVPTITQHPADQTVVIGQAAAFSVAAIGTPALLYQWLKSGFPLTGKTNSSLLIPGVQEADAGSYSVSVSNHGGTATSVTAALTVTPPPIAPAIVTQPLGQIVEVGKPVTFTAAASGSLPQSWKWRLGTKDLAGETNATLALLSAATNQVGLYSALVTNGAGSATSQHASLAVYVPPADQESPAASNVTFRVPTYGAGPFSYQWRLTGVPITGATSPSLVLTNVDLDDAGAYSVIVSNASTVSTSSPAILVVDMPPLITAQPSNALLAEGGAGLLSVTVAGSPILSYQWRRNGTNLTGATSSGLGLSSAQTNDAGYYSVVAQNAFGSVTSRVAVVTVASASAALLRFEDAAGSAGAVISVPLNLIGLGDENTVACSLSFDSTLLSLASITNGAAIVPGISVILNTNDVAKGKAGVLIARGAGESFAAGTNHLLTLSFKVATTVTRTLTTSIAFASAPIAPELISPTVRPLAALYQNATVSLDAGLEGDIAAEPSGDGQLTAADWTLMGRLVAGLSKTANAGEFARADCAPTETLGDGYLTAADWTQAGRYVLGIDPARVTGGPSQAAPQSVASNGDGLGLNADHAPEQPRRPVARLSLNRRRIEVASASVEAGQEVELPLRLVALGDENTAAFSLRFDPAQLQVRSVQAGTALTSGTTLLVNTNQALHGRVGVLLGQPVGKTFQPGAQELLSIVVAAVRNNGQPALIDFDDAPVVREVVSPIVRVLPTTYISGTVLITEAAPATRAIAFGRTVDGSLSMRWGVAKAGNYALEGSSDLIHWDVLRTVNVAAAGEVDLAEPMESEAAYRFFRLR
ncbi:MAG: immunoglobulin domain-containing protein [Verrucomicrobiota bacterium]